jgi:hypothetical protein
MSARALAAALVALAAVAAPAAAQSTRHPKPPVDVEAEDEAKSEFWEEVIRPGAKRYEQLVKSGTELLKQRIPDSQHARDALVEATMIRGDLVEGWGYLGKAQENLATAAGEKSKPADWRACADSYGKAFAIDPSWRPKRLLSNSDPSVGARDRGNRPLEVGWATCLARAGDIDRATEALEALVARGEATGESWLRLGEVYMAAGRLTEAITALEQARNEKIANRRAQWLLAIAYDRARRPGEAEAIAADAGDIMNVVRQDVLVFVPPSDTWYLQAYGSRNRPGRSLALFRMYLAKAPAESPWRARAQEHIEALLDVDLATTVEIAGGPGDRPGIEKAVRSAMPALRRCVASVPEVYFDLTITQVGPVKAIPPPPPVPRAKGVGHYRTPGPYIPPRPQPAPLAPGVRADLVVWEPGVADSARNQAIECAEKLGMSLTLPRPPANSSYILRIPVVADR